MTTTTILIIIASFLVFNANCDQFVPIPATQGGFKYPVQPKVDPKIRIDLYMDLCCSDCRAFYPQFKKFLQMGVTQNLKVVDVIDLHFHFISLPYHTYSFITHKLQNFISLNYSGEQTLVYIDTIFNNQDKFLSGAQNLNLNQVIDQAISLAAQNLKVEQSELRKAWDGYTYEMNARVEWKDAVYNQIVGTPGMKLNGVLLQEVPMDAQDMYSFFKTYLVNSLPKKTLRN